MLPEDNAAQTETMLLHAVGWYRFRAIKPVVLQVNYAESQVGPIAAWALHAHGHPDYNDTEDSC